MKFKISKNQLIMSIAGLAVILLIVLNAIRFDYAIFAGNNNYNIRSFDIAESYYRDAGNINKNSYIPLNNSGNVEYQKGDFDLAIESYNSASKLCDSNCDIALYNLGNSYYKSGETKQEFEEKKSLYEQAISSYEKSLNIKEDQLTRENLEFVLNKLKELEEQQAEQNQGQDGQNSDQQDGDSEDGQGNSGEEEGTSEKEPGTSEEEEGTGEQGQGASEEQSQLDEETTQQVEQYMQQLQQIEKDAQQYHKRNDSEEESTPMNDLFESFFGRPSPFANDPFFNPSLRQDTNEDPNVKDW